MVQRVDGTLNPASQAAWCRCHVVGCRFAPEPPAGSADSQSYQATEKMGSTRWPAGRLHKKRSEPEVFHKGGNL